MIFSYENLEKFLIQAKKYRVYPLSSFKGKTGIILRHDVDLYLEPALEMARLERKNGISSTFCVMLTSVTYNSFCAKNQKIIRQLAIWGFDVGLHFDPTVYDVKSTRALQDRLKIEANILSGITGQKIKTVSLHNPSIYGKFSIPKPYIDAYSPEIFQKDRYLSDSCLVFRQDPFEFIKKADRELVQVLLHPLAYTQEGDSYKKIFSQFLEDFIDGVDQTLRPNKTYASEIKPDLIRVFRKNLSDRR